jgi:hypothetical protein
MIEPVPPELNLNNLRDLFARLDGIEAFIFFGTLLGYTREGNIIPHDDDIDIYVNYSHRKRLLKALRASGFVVKQMPHKKWRRLKLWPRSLMVQAKRMQDGRETFADFYLYDARPQSYVIDRWNFRGHWRDPDTTMHVPKDLLFPLRKAVMQDVEIVIPAQPEALCAFLYGENWRIPVRKGSGYVMEIQDHRPKFVPIA